MIDLPPDAALIANTPRLRLVPLTSADTTELFGLLRDSRLHLHGASPPLEEADLAELVRARERRRSPDGKAVWIDWVLRLVPLGELVGTVSATVEDDGVAAISCVVGARYTRHGFATEASMAMGRLLETHLGVTHWAATAGPPESASGRLAARLGMAPSEVISPTGVLWFGPVPASMPSSARPV